MKKKKKHCETDYLPGKPNYKLGPLRFNTGGANQLIQYQRKQNLFTNKYNEQTNKELLTKHLKIADWE
jgi:hypothetical protein